MYDFQYFLGGTHQFAQPFILHVTRNNKKEYSSISCIFYSLILKKTQSTLVNSYVYLLYVHANFLKTGLYLSSCRGRIVAIAELPRFIECNYNSGQISELVLPSVIDKILIFHVSSEKGKKKKRKYVDVNEKKD